ncbi:MAG: hypothetical protein PWP39_85 [Pyrococcus sp.]|nr:hypothetical protein [Pyrococcus sp.]
MKSILYSENFIFFEILIYHLGGYIVHELLKLDQASVLEITSIVSRNWPNKLIVVFSGEYPVLFYSNGTLVKSSSSQDVLQDVKVCEVDKFEFLDLFMSEPKVSQVDRAEKYIPKVVEFSYSLVAPSELYLKILNAIVEFAKFAYRRLGLSIELLDATCRLVSGSTGRDILSVDVEVYGYSSKPENELREAIRSNFSKLIREIVGFPARINIKGLEIVHTEEIPKIKIEELPVEIKGGRVVEINLREEIPHKIKIRRRQVEAEVERIIEESGIREIISSIKDLDSESRINKRKIEEKVKANIDRTIKGIKVNWAKLSKVGSSYQIFIGIERTSRSIDELKLSDEIKKLIKNVEEEIRSQGNPISIGRAIVIIEKDIY